MKKTAAHIDALRRDSGDASYRNIAAHYGIDKEYENIRRVHVGLGLGDAKVKKIALAMHIIKPRPPYHKYRPCLHPDYRRYSNIELMEIVDEWEKKKTAS